MPSRFLHGLQAGLYVRTRVCVTQLILARMLKTVQSDLMALLADPAGELGLSSSLASEYEKGCLDVSSYEGFQHGRRGIDGRSVVERQYGVLTSHALDSRISAPAPRPTRMQVEEAHSHRARNDAGNTVLDACRLRLGHLRIASLIC
jgi:hypothetical protein